MTTYAPSRIAGIHSLAPPLVRVVAAGVTAVGAQAIAYTVLRRRIGPEHASLADALTLSRGLCGALLAALIAGGRRERADPGGWLGFLATLGGTTISDWLDGPLARRRGATRLGAALDIEADSWLTVWAAAAAAAWGGLPRWCLVAPLLHYLHPLRALRMGRLPTGGGPWWARATGTAQMALFLAALAPVGPRLSPQAFAAATAVIGVAQIVAQLALLGQAPAAT